jgi:pimeloyl-ACP methyl ester carboxylesterase
VLTEFDQSPFLVGASLGGLASILLAGEIAPGSVRGVILVDIVPEMEPVGADRIHDFMVDNMDSGFGSLDEVADAVAAYNPHRPRPTDLNGLRKNVRERDGRFYWHWDPKFMHGSGGPSEIRDVERLHRATGEMVSQASVMLVRGRASDLVSEKRAGEFCAMFPSVEFADVSGAGHMVAGDRNDAFNTAIIEFLNPQLGEK